MRHRDRETEKQELCGFINDMDWEGKHIIAEMRRDIVKILQHFQSSESHGKVLTYKGFWKILGRHETQWVEKDAETHVLDVIFYKVVQFLEQGTRGEITMEEFLSILDKHMPHSKLQEASSLAL